MRASLCIINIVSSASKLIIGRKKRSRFFSSACSALPLSSFLKDEQLLSDETRIYSGELLPVSEHLYPKTAGAFGKNYTIKFAPGYSYNYESHIPTVVGPSGKRLVTPRGGHVFESSWSHHPGEGLSLRDPARNCVSNIFQSPPKDYKSHNLENHELERIKTILRNCGWNLGFENGDVGLDQENIARILNDLFVESSDASVSLYFFRWSECYTGLKHTIQSICTMVHISISGNMNYIAIDLIRQLVRSNEGDVVCHNLLLRVLQETHTERNTLVTAYSMLIDSYIQEDMVGVALELSSQMKHLSFFPSLGVCNSLLKALLRSEQLERAWDFVEEMQSQGMALNASIISLFLHKYCSDGNLGAGLKLLTEMKRFGINPDIVSYTIVINSLCKKYHLKEATSMLFKMTQMGISLDSVSVSSLVDGYCKVGKLEKAISLLQVFGFPPNIYVYNSLISKLCTDGNVEAAVSTFKEMLELGLNPDCFSYSTMIGGFCKIGEVNLALNFVGNMLKKGVQISVATYTVFIDSYCKSGNLEMAEHLFQKMVTDGLVPDVVAYNALMDGYGKKGHLHKAFELLDLMRSANVIPDIVTYNIIIHGLIMRGFVNEARGILDELIRRGVSPDVVTFTDIISGLSNKENFEEAYLLWFHMNERGVKPDVVTCNALLNGYCRARRMDEANNLFCKMLDVGLVPDLLLYNTLIHGFCCVGSMDNACQLVDMMVEDNIIPNEVTHRALVLGYEKKWAENPVEAASFKLQQILKKHGC